MCIGLVATAKMAGSYGIFLRKPAKYKEATHHLYFGTKFAKIIF